MKYVSPFLHSLLDSILPKHRFSSRKQADIEGTLSETYQLKPVYENIWALFPYKNPVVKEALHALKFYGDKKAASYFAPYIAEAVFEILGDALLAPNEKVLVLPIPRTKKSERERNVNQSEVLASQSLGDREGFEVDKKVLLRASHHTNQSHTRSRKERFENIKGAFKVTDSSSVAGRTILVIDDVVTTGATLNEARRVLLAHGASNVLCLAVAH